MSEITASVQELFEQAPINVHYFLSAAKTNIDNTFGKGFSAMNPELVGAYIQACATDFASSTRAKVVSNAIEVLAEKKTYSVSESIAELSRAIGDTFSES